LFNDIDTAIRNEQLYKNVNLQRQDICDRFSISRHTLNDLLAEHTNGLSFPQYVNNIRLEVALRLLRDEPTKTVSAIATEVGFTPANLREQFKRKYGMTPADYRQNQ
jgi:AraC-like DNA-binding protein